MNGVLACLTGIAGFILGVRVGFALARRNGITPVHGGRGSAEGGTRDAKKKAK